MYTEGNLVFRKATLADVPLLRKWDDMPHVVASDPKTDWNWEEELGEEPWWREQFLVLLGDRPAGFLQLMDTAEQDYAYWSPDPAGQRAIDIWIGEPDLLGQGIGTRMMIWAIDRCFGPQDVQAIVIDPLIGNTRAHRFYERLGFRFLEERNMDGDECRIYRLAREDWGHRRRELRPAGP